MLRQPARVQRQPINMQRQLANVQHQTYTLWKNQTGKRDNLVSYMLCYLKFPKQETVK